MLNELSGYQLETLMRLRHEALEREVATARLVAEFNRATRPTHRLQWPRWLRIPRVRRGLEREINHANAAT